MKISLNKGIIIFIPLFFLQCFLLVRGPIAFSIYFSPILLFIVSIAIFWFSVKLEAEKINTAKNNQNTSFSNRVLIFIIGFIFLLSAYEEIRKLFDAFPFSEMNSDVIPQLETLYRKWKSGLFPYTPDEQISHKPFPAYMPMHWLPLFISDSLKLDARWSSVMVYFILSALSILFLLNKKLDVFYNFLIAIIPGILLWIIVLFFPANLTVATELIVVAYYLLLCATFFSKRFFWLLISIVFCLMSRYIILFWMPLFFYFTIKKWTLKKNIIAYSLIFIGIFFIYISPFLLKDPSIFYKAVHYHNQCSYDALLPMGTLPMGWSCTYGIYFAIYFKMLFPTLPTADLSLIIRMVQLFLMLFIIGVSLFYQYKNKIDFSRKGISILYLIVLCFYFFSPLAFVYYYFLIIMLSLMLLIQFIYSSVDD